MSFKSNFQVIMQRPLEPIFVRKGFKGERFQIPKSFYDERYRDIVDKLIDIYNKKEGPKIIVKPIKLPDLKFTERLSRYDMFSTCIPFHRKIADQLVELFMNCSNIEELQSTAIYCRDRVNHYVFNYALSITILHRSDTKGIEIPHYYEIFPEKFITSDMFLKIREESGVVPQGSRIPIVQPMALTATLGNLEQKCAYFREDLSLNLSYWNWNMMYPSDISNPQILNKDRRGELFFYYHHQILARYNSERFCNNLHRVEPLNNLRAPIAEGYFAKLDSQLSSNAYPPRFKNTVLKDLRRESEGLHFDLYTLERWIDRIVDAIEVGFIITENQEKVLLKNDRGIDILGNLIQSTASSVNRGFYGDLCQLGKVFIAYSHDSTGKHLESHGIIADNATALRDPVFYRWHAFLNEIFILHKNTLLPYTEEELNYPGISLLDLEVEKDDQTEKSRNTNELVTFWQQIDADAGPGLNFSSSGGVFVRLTHLQHRPFTMKLKIRNNTKAEAMVTVRLFLAPEYNERGLKMSYQEQRQFMIEIDRFVTKASIGSSAVTRKSDQSSIIQIRSKYASKISNRICKTGWPGHLLIPKGDENGVSYVLFAMLTDYNKDKINLSQEQESCKVGSLYYGIFRDNFPDRKPMGYPFDRRAPIGVETLSEFLLPNMKFLNISIRHENTVVPP